MYYHNKLIWNHKYQYYSLETWSTTWIASFGTEGVYIYIHTVKHGLIFLVLESSRFGCRNIRNYMIGYTSVWGELTRHGAPPPAETNGEGSASLVRPASSGAARVLGCSDARGREKQPRAVNHAVARCAEAGAGPEGRGTRRWWSARAQRTAFGLRWRTASRERTSRGQSDKDLTADITLEKY